MKNGSLFFLGLFAALGLAWVGIVVSSNAQIGSLTGYYDDTDSTSYPARPSGLAAQGALVYKDLGCASCHTQQVRRPGFGSDQDRGWGERQSVARDYIYQTSVQLGESRIGQDLTNLAGRKPSAPDQDDLLHMLYQGQGAMPSYQFLFEAHKIQGEASSEALKLTGKQKPQSGFEIIPTTRAKELVAYLLSLNTTYDYPEAHPVAGAKGEGEK
jgi:cytochrome c oxidase cbb3-type subunit 2